MYYLEEHEGGHGSKSKSTVGGAESGSCVGLAALCSWLVASRSGVHNLALAEVATSDRLLVLEVLVEVAGRGNVFRRLEVEGALDIVDLGSFHPVVI